MVYLLICCRRRGGNGRVTNRDGTLCNSRRKNATGVKGVWHLYVLIMMMKNGLIIDRGKPNDLVKKHGRQNLEEVFLKLVRN